MKRLCDGQSLKALSATQQDCEDSPHGLWVGLNLTGVSHITTVDCEYSCPSSPTVQPNHLDAPWWLVRVQPIKPLPHLHVSS